MLLLMLMMLRYRLELLDHPCLAQVNIVLRPLPGPGTGIRVGHAYAEYANDADYAHMRNMRMRMRIENLIHIIHI